MANDGLPLDVVEKIIDIVGAESEEYCNQFEDLPSLKACALVCHSFLALCRKHIFAHVALGPSSRPSDDLNHLLSNSPHLAVYIRKLDYQINENEFVPKRLPWLSSMFKKLVKLQKLKISYWGSDSEPGRRLDWMSSSERNILLPLLHLPTLTSISLSTIQNFPLADLAGCVSLKELQIYSLQCSTDVGKFLDALPATPVMLERLVIHDGNIKTLLRLYHAQRPDGKPIIDPTSLKIISATITRLDLLTELCGICRNLHKIDLTIIKRTKMRNPSRESTSSLKGFFTMLKPSLPTLVDIYIDYNVVNDDETQNGPLAGLCHELEKMGGQNVVETITLHIRVQQGYDCTRWGELDDVLMGSPDGWPALRNVSLTFHLIVTETSSWGDDPDKALRELPMTKLVESKRVQFDLQVNGI